MTSRSGPSLLPTVVAAPLQRAVGLGCCADTGVPAEQEGAAPPTAHGVVGCSPSGAPTQTYLRGNQVSQDLQRCLVGGILGTPGYMQINFPHAVNYHENTPKLTVTF